MIKPRIKGKWFEAHQGGAKDLKWQRQNSEDTGWYHFIEWAIMGWERD